MYIRGEREKKRERRQNLVCSAANCHIDLVTWQTQLDLRLSLWDVLYFCRELSASERLRRKRDMVSE